MAHLQNQDIGQIAEGPELEVPPRNANGAVNFMRMPPRYTQNNDIDLFLRRFRSYMQAAGIRGNDRVNALLSLLDDPTILAIERHLDDENIDFEELVEILRRETGVALANREFFIKELRTRKQEKDESVRTFFQKLYQLARKSYDNEAVAANALRENFIYKLRDAQISSRLREHPGMTNEDLLQLAVTLEACKVIPGTDKSLLDVNAAVTDPAGTQPLSAGKKDRRDHQTTSMETVVGMLQGLSAQVSTMANNSARTTPDSEVRYHYQGSKVTPGLREQEHNGYYSDNFNNRGYQNNGQREHQTREWQGNSNYQPRGNNFRYQQGGNRNFWQPNRSNVDRERYSRDNDQQGQWSNNSRRGHGQRPGSHNQGYRPSSYSRGNNRGFNHSYNDSRRNHYNQGF